MQQQETSKFDIFSRIDLPANLEKSRNIQVDENDVLPHLFDRLLILSPSGGGKTTLLFNLLRYYRQYYNFIIAISSSCNNDAI